MLSGEEGHPGRKGIFQMLGGSVNELRRRRIAQRLGAAGAALATALVLAGCHEARGGGYIGVAADGSPTFNREAIFGFFFQCDDGIEGQITYYDRSTKGLYPGLKIHGTVENVLIDHDDNETTPAVPTDTCEDLIDAPVAHFEGSYRSQQKSLTSKPQGRFNILVFDEGEPGRTEEGGFTGDGFSIELTGGAYPLYTRAGYIEGGNIQVD